MFSIAIFLLSVCSTIRANSWDSNNVFLSNLQRKLIDLEHRLQVQERINRDQEVVIKRLILENDILKNVGMTKTDISVDMKKQNESEGFIHSSANKNTTGEKNTGQNMHLSYSKSDLKISRKHFSLGNCCQKLLFHFKNDKPIRKSVTGGVAFYSYLSHDEDSLGHHQTIIFDNVITNVGGNYNRHTGTFFCPMDGVYTFSWTLYCSSGGYFTSEIVVNSNAVGAMFCSAQGATNIRHTTGVVVVEINQGDVVYIRTHPNNGLSGPLRSHSTYRSSFTGWKHF
ncbi:uncharacterized protein LOC134273081 [Saccostrea cucullata]|uniref:uncharacterized protein LOC134273081 n=1 Tax=Saccostrea cuccullata TaxID=36930 RepID=UPI002ED5C01C